MKPKRLIAILAILAAIVWSRIVPVYAQSATVLIKSCEPPNQEIDTRILEKVEEKIKEKLKQSLFLCSDTFFKKTERDIGTRPTDEGRYFIIGKKGFETKYLIVINVEILGEYVQGIFRRFDIEKHFPHLSVSKDTMCCIRKIVVGAKGEGFDKKLKETVNTLLDDLPPPKRDWTVPGIIAVNVAGLVGGVILPILCSKNDRPSGELLDDLPPPPKIPIKP